MTYPVAAGSCSGLAIVRDAVYIACERGTRMYREVIINSRWGFASAAAIIVLIIVSFAGVFAVRPIEQAQEETMEELIGADSEGAGPRLEEAIAAEAQI